MGENIDILYYSRLPKRIDFWERLVADKKTSVEHTDRRHNTTSPRGSYNLTLFNKLNLIYQREFDSLSWQGKDRSHC